MSARWSRKELREHAAFTVQFIVNTASGIHLGTEDQNEYLLLVIDGLKEARIANLPKVPRGSDDR